MAKITDILKHNEKTLTSAKHLIDGKGHGMEGHGHTSACLLYTSPSPRDQA